MDHPAWFPRPAAPLLSKRPYAGGPAGRLDPHHQDADEASAHRVDEAAIAAENERFAAMLLAPEAKEAFTAFFEKRKPDFSKFD